MTTEKLAPVAAATCTIGIFMRGCPARKLLGQDQGSRVQDDNLHAPARHHHMHRWRLDARVPHAQAATSGSDLKAQP